MLIAGPTASGKSALALALAERHGGCVINADALQVYACWRVLTARPGDAELARAPHMLYGHVGCDVRYSVGAWLRDVAAALADARRRGLRPIVVGGTGLYLGALTEGLADIPPIPPEIRARSEALLGAGRARRAARRPRARRPGDARAHRPQQPDAGAARLGGPDRHRPRPLGVARHDAAAARAARGRPSGWSLSRKHPG